MTCTTEAKVSTSLRLRAYHAGQLIANTDATVLNHRATFGVKLNEHRTGTYRFVVSFDAAGQAGELTRSVRID